MTAADTWHGCTDRRDRIRVIIIGGKVGPDLGRQPVLLSAQCLGYAVKLLWGPELGSFARALSCVGLLVKAPQRLGKSLVRVLA